MTAQPPSPGQLQAEEKLVLQVCLVHRVEIVWRDRPKGRLGGHLPAQSASCPRGHEVRTWGCLSVRTGKLLAIGGARIVAFSDKLDTISRFLSREPEREAAERQLDLQVLRAMGDPAMTSSRLLRERLGGNKDRIYEAVARVLGAGWANCGGYGEPYQITPLGTQVLDD